MKLNIGTLEYFSDKLWGGTNKHEKKKPFQTVELKVRMDCEDCENNVKKAVSSISGVETMDVDRKMQKVTVSGYVDPKEVLNKVKGTGKRAEMWPYVPYNAVAQPVVTAQTYDKKAPPEYVRKVSLESVPSSNRVDLFSEENPYACSIM